MKKILLVAAVMAASSASALAQNNVVKANILSPIFKTGSFFYEHKLTDNSSVQLGALITNWNIDDETKMSGFAFTPEYRFYLSEKTTALEGFYVGPYLRYQNLNIESSSYDFDPNTGAEYTSKDEATLTTFGGGVVVGRQWIFKERFSLDTFLGPAYNGGEVKIKTSGSDPESFDPGPLSGFGLRAGITFGIAF